MAPDRSAGSIVPFLLVSLIWGSTWIVIKDQLAVVPPAWSVTYRFIIASAAMFVLAWFARRSVSIPRAAHLSAATVGLLEFCFEYNLVYAAERHITSGVVAVIFALLFIPNAALAWVFFGHRVSLRFLLGSLAAMAGVGCLLLAEMRAGSASGPNSLLGIGLALLAVLCASCSNVLQIAERVKALPLAALLAWVMLYSVGFNAAYALLSAGLPVVEARPGYWIGLLYLGVIASAVVFWLYFGLIRSIGPAKAAYVTVLIPIIAMAISTFAEGYLWTPLSLAGGLLALAGMIVALSAKGEGSKSSPAEG